MWQNCLANLKLSRYYVQNFVIFWRWFLNSRSELASFLKVHSHSTTTTKLFLVWKLSLISKQSILRWSHCRCRTVWAHPWSVMWLSSIAVAVTVASCDWVFNRKKLHCHKAYESWIDTSANRGMGTRQFFVLSIVHCNWISIILDSR